MKEIATYFDLAHIQALELLTAWTMHINRNGQLTTAPHPLAMLYLQVSTRRLLKNENLRKYLGLASVPLPHPVPQRAKIWERVLPTEAGNSQQGNQVSQEPLPCLNHKLGDCLLSCFSSRPCLCTDLFLADRVDVLWLSSYPTQPYYSVLLISTSD